MKRIKINHVSLCSLAMLLIAATSHLNAQTITHSPKPAVDFAAMSNWPEVLDPVISNDGKYILYYVRYEYQAHMPSYDKTALVVKALQGDWKIELMGARFARFTADNRSVIFLSKEKILSSLRVGSSEITNIGVNAAGKTRNYINFNLISDNAGEWLVNKNPDQTLILHNLTDGKDLSFPKVSNYTFNSQRETLLLTCDNDSTLQWVDMPSGNPHTLLKGEKIEAFELSPDAARLAIKTTHAVGDHSNAAIWYYDHESDKLSKLLDEQSGDLPDGLLISDISRFSHDGKRLFLELKDEDKRKPNPDMVKMDVWNYRDATPKMFESTSTAKTYMYVMQLTGDRKPLRLGQANEEVSILGDDDNWAFMINGIGREEWNWNPQVRPQYFLVSTLTGERKRLPLDDCENVWPSPTGKFLIGWTYGRADYYSYEVSTGQVRNITKNFRKPPANRSWPTGDPSNEPESSASKGLRDVGWSPDGSSILITDSWDIWKMDLQGKKAPVCLTNRYGFRNNIAFNLLPLQFSDGNKEIVLNAFDAGNKDAGYYRIRLDAPGRDPEKLTMGPYHYAYNGKANDASLYIVNRESTWESSNVYWTDDWKTFHAITDVHPERAYNWLTSTLVSFKTTDGRTEQGVLYKPENFDPKKKYPVIFTYYEKESQNKNIYRSPSQLTDLLPISWLVSNGYIVFVPDISPKIGHPGFSAYQSVVGGARYLSQFKWVDARHMGMMGHSYSGFETYFVATHSNLFAAALASAGLTDAISAYGDYEDPINGSYWFEIHQDRLAATPWQRLDLYLEHSPLFRADKVQTPMLILANKADFIGFAQGGPFFMALRRMGKPAWLLQYDGEGHSAGSGKNRTDYWIRMKQFFDHYLKGAPPAKWMTKGIPASLKGIEDGLELDTSGDKLEPLKLGPPAIFDPLTESRPHK